MLERKDRDPNGKKPLYLVTYDLNKILEIFGMGF